nr:MAG TPA: hypothetical protein [Bacteriophage sp.]
MWLRWTITKLRGTTNICQMAELYLYDKNGNKLDWTAGTSISAPSKASYSSSEGPEKIIDGKVDTKFCLLNFNIYTENGMAIVIKIPDILDIDSYSYVTANDSTERDPISWILELSYDNETWFTVSEISGATITNNRLTETQKWGVLSSTWSADANYMMITTGDICTVAGRTYSKINSDRAIVGAFYNIGGYTGPILVSDIPQAVSYYAYGSTFTYIDTIEYLGITWYISSTKYFMEGNYSVSGYAQKLSDEPMTYKQAAELLLQKANVTIPITISIKYLIQSDNILYTIENNELKALEVTELTSETFKTYGSDTAPTFDILNVFTNPKVYCWTDDTQSHALTASVKATPKPQTVITNDIDLSDPSITGIEKVTAEYTGDPHVACSFDGGTTWKLYNGSAWVVLSETETGMTMETLLAITTENWSTVIEGLDSFKMRFTLATTDDTVTNIVINFTN